MRKSALCFAALLLAASAPVAALDDFEVFTHARPSLVQLVGIGAEGRYHLGSGVVLPNGTVITNCHVTQRAKSVQLFRGIGAPSARLQTVDVVHDLCQVHFPGFERPPAVLGTSRSLKPGDRVYSIGFNAGNGLSYQVGEVAELFEHDGGMVIRTTAAFTHGASGGGLFDSEGRLVGVLTFFRVAPSGPSYFAVPAEWLEPLATKAAAEVGPFEGTPFWADQIERQPAFLQAGALEADKRWNELAALALQWTQTRPEDSQAWLTLGKASANLGDQLRADEAFRRAVQLGASLPAALPSSPEER